MLKLNSAAIIQAMNVLPTDAPMRIGRAWTSVSIPACTKLTVIREAAVEDCIMAVTNAPVSNENMSEPVSGQLLQTLSHESCAVHQQAKAT